MTCVRCGAVFDGSFCPRCGAPAAASPTSFAAPPAPVGWPCPRCGTMFSGSWTHDAWGTASTSAYQAAGGHADGFLEMRLCGTNARSYWRQSFNVGGSQAYTRSVHVDLQIVGGLTSGRLIVSVDSSISA